MNYYAVAVNTPFNKSILSYSYHEKLQPGDMVKVPLGKRETLGVILKETEIESGITYKEIKETLEYQFKITKDYLDLITLVANYYYYPVGQLCFDIFPKKMKRPRGEAPTIQGTSISKLAPNEEQSIVIEKIKSTFSANQFNQFLIHGVTGSGKTLIYVELMKKIISSGKSVLFLLPEINLTPQFVKDLSEQLGCPLISYNSSLNDSERYHVWKTLSEDTTPKVLIGVRSSVFLPLKNIGLIVVDEEHDSSFKQEDRCTYNARDVALIRGQKENCTVILGSATPSVETYFRFQNSLKHNYFKLSKRANGLEMPDIEFVDRRGVSADEVLIGASMNKLIKTKEDNRQSIIYINRLGFSQSLYCSSCGERIECPNCSIALRFFKRKNLVRCSCCNYEAKKPDSCKSCGNLKLEPVGIGTERVLEFINNKSSKLNVKRFDREELKSFEDVKDLLTDFSSGKVDALVGTQMVTKGHNFEKVDTVVILGIDSQLNFPDFRSGERVFQQIIQVAGRAGRFDKKGSVIIETVNKDNDIFKFVKTYDVENFYKYEIDLRKITHFPPFSHIALITITGANIRKVVEVSQEIYQKLSSYKVGQCELMRPKAAGVEKRVNKYSWNVFVRAPNRSDLRSTLDKWYNFNDLYSGVTVKIDVDPQTIN